jgi:hypothetical protein
VGLQQQYFKRTADNLPAAQYYDSDLDELIPQEGKDGATYVIPFRSASKVDTLQNAAAANGDGTPQDVEGYASAAIQISGTFSATVSFLGSVDGTNYVPLLVLDQNGSATSSATGAGIFKLDCAGLKSIKTPISNMASGSVTVVSRLLPEARPTNQSVQLSGSLLERYGASLSDRPPASSVSVGATFMVVGTDIVYQSNGTDWVVIS